MKHLGPLGKSELELIERARRYNGHVGINWGAQARRKFGCRELHAASKLVRRGLMVRVPSASDGGVPLYKNGWGINGYVYSSTYKIAEGPMPKQ